MSDLRAEARIDLGAIERNVAVLRGRAPTAAVMAVVKADGYGHGAVESARAALRGGASWLGVAYPGEAAALRAAGIDAPVLAWLLSPYEDLTEILREGVDVSVSDVAMLEHVVAQARLAGVVARVHLKVDTGLSRAGATIADWPQLVEAAAKAQADAAIEVAAVWSHFACADTPRHPSVAAQQALFAEALRLADSRGVRPPLRHFANSAAMLALPEVHFDLVRVGITAYGVSPGPEIGTPRDLGLTPAMTLAARVAVVKKVPAGTGISYGHRYHTGSASRLALVPLGYADGIPRNATNVGPVQVAGRRHTVSGTVCMDQFVVDVGDDEVGAGDEVVLFGPGTSGEPTADDWARATGTIAYEIVTRVGARVPRVYVGAAG